MGGEGVLVSFGVAVGGAEVAVGGAEVAVFGMAVEVGVAAGPGWQAPVSNPTSAQIG